MLGKKGEGGGKVEEGLCECLPVFCTQTHMHSVHICKLRGQRESESLYCSPLASL